jgi:hypothetical protein
MTKAEKFMQSGKLSIELSVNSSDKSPEIGYIAEFKPDYLNVLHIKDIDHDEHADGYTGNFIAISYESAVDLAKFLKELFLDEEPQE